jgi:hypothetical protein
VEQEGGVMDNFFPKVRNSRLETVGEFTKQRVAQAKGPTLAFQGKLLCSTEWENGDQTIVCELWETPERNWIALTSFERDDREAVARAVVIDRIGDEQAMRFAAMDAWDWHFRARSMVKEQLKWSLARNVP